MIRCRPLAALTAAAILIAGPALAAPPRLAPFPATQGRPFSITLSRTPCFGRCPVYEVTIASDGVVTYRGREFVRVSGLQQRRIPPAQARALLEQFRQVGFFSLKDSYRGPVTDMPSQIITLKIGGRAKTVRDYAGQMAGMPAGVEALEESIDRVAGTSVWIGRP